MVMSMSQCGNTQNLRPLAIKLDQPGRFHHTTEHDPVGGGGGALY